MNKKDNEHEKTVKNKAKNVVEKTKKKINAVKDKTNKFLEEMGDSDEDL